MGMRNMQELHFWLGGLRWDSLCTQSFHFCHWKEHNFQKTKISERQRKPNLSELTHIMWSTLSTVKILLSENEMHRYHAFRCLLCRRCLVSSHNALYFPFERERVAWRDQITVTKETTLTAVPPKESQNSSSTVSFLKNIIPRNFATKSEPKLCCTSNRP